MDRDALQLIIDTIANSLGDDYRPGRPLPDTNVIALPDNFRLHDLNKHQPRPLRQFGKFTTGNVNAFAQYCIANGDEETPIYVDADKWQATAVFNYGDHHMPGHCDDLGALQLCHTPEYATLLQAANGEFTQEEFTEWLEDNAACIMEYADNADVTVLHAQAIAAIRNIKVTSGRTSTHETEDMRRERGVLERIEVANADAFPSRIYYECFPAIDLPARRFRIRVRVGTSHDKPRIFTRVVSLQKEQAEIAIDFRDLVTSAVNGVSYIGTYKAGA